jgi:hypothetical protein
MNSGLLGETLWKFGVGKFLTLMRGLGLIANPNLRFGGEIPNPNLGLGGEIPNPKNFQYPTVTAHEGYKP